MKILVADDDLHSRLMLEMLCKQWAYEVILAEDGDQAWQLISDEDAPKLLLLDWEMPGLTGPELCARVRQLSFESKPYIILLTARGKTEEIAYGLDQGANDFISKPYEIKELEARLAVGRRLLEMQELYVQAQKEKIRELEEEQEVAKLFYEKIVKLDTLEERNTDIHVSPFGIFSGDLLLSQLDDKDRLHLIIADMTGHGLSAAICLIPMSLAFQEAMQAGLSEEVIINKLNESQRPFASMGKFCAACYVVIDFAANTYKYWNAGIPYPKHFQAKEQIFYQLQSKNLPLGATDCESLQVEFIVQSYNRGDQLVFYTDGLIEVKNTAEELFGKQRLAEVIAANIHEPGLYNCISKELSNFSGGLFQDDDITFLRIKL